MDLIFVVGLVIGLFSIPAFASAFANRRWPKMAVLLAVIGGGLVGFVIQQNPDVYTVEAVPDVIVGVLARYIP